MCQDYIMISNYFYYKNVVFKQPSTKQFELETRLYGIRFKTILKIKLNYNMSHMC